MTKTRTNRTARRVLVGMLFVWLSLSGRVTGQVTRTADEVKKLAVGKYKVRVYWGNHLQLKATNLSQYAGNSAGSFVPNGEVELIERNKRLVIKGEPFDGEIPLTIEGLRLSMSLLKVAAQPNVNARVKYTNLTLLQSLDALMLCGLSNFTNGGPEPGNKFSTSGGQTPNCHGIAAFYLVRSDGRREKYNDPIGTDGEVFRPKFQLGGSDVAGLASGAVADANTLLGTWLQANGFDLQPNPKVTATFQFRMSVIPSFTPPLVSENAKFSRFVAADGTNDVVVTNPMGIECGVTLTNAALAGKPLLRTVSAIGLPGAATVPDSCDLKTEIRTLFVENVKVNVYQPSPCYQYPSPLVMMLPARLALERGQLKNKGFSSRLEEIAYRRK